MSSIKDTKVVVQMAGKDDFPAILAMREACLDYLKTYRAIVEDRDLDIVNSYLCVAKINGRVVGSGRADLLKPSVYKLTRVVTSEEVRLAGIGSQVIKHLEDYVKARKGLKVSLKTRQQTASFYKKLGYTKVGKYKNKQGTNYVYLTKKII
ncbi:GNAT family N-acetyltransferase [Candidatus Saccharibacteria bacterium]|nr:GNAT family N-acetyltransferase [Candidatus Saccharibacteria bacterium]